jgi:hypothetical protein
MVAQAGALLEVAAAAEMMLAMHLALEGLAL